MMFKGVAPWVYVTLNTRGYSNRWKKTFLEMKPLGFDE